MWASGRHSYVRKKSNKKNPNTILNIKYDKSNIYVSNNRHALCRVEILSERKFNKRYKKQRKVGVYSIRKGAGKIKMCTNEIMTNLVICGREHGKSRDRVIYYKISICYFVR